MTAKFDELIAKLKEIFQIDKPELDFGIYRILHARQREISDFLENRLAAKVKATLAGNAASEAAAIKKELEEAMAQAKSLDVDPDSIPKVKELKGRLAAQGGGDQAEGEVYSHLLTFFSRYYEDGDFISKRRYKGDTYAIPYSGEEVKLHWANADQYYTKSGESFTNYAFTLDGGARVHFTLVTAATAKDNIKDNDCVRCFKLWDPAAVELSRAGSAEDEESEELATKLPSDFMEEKNGELHIYFQYLKFKKGTKQKEFLEEAADKILPRIMSMPRFHGLVASAPTEKDKKRSLLQKHLERYTAKNTSDYFIHKDLRGFLTRELDFYIKNEMMHLDDIADATAFRQIEANLRKIQTVRVIALELIAFMAQLENFQKKLWLKKKFVVQCDWCMTMDIVPENMRDEVFANKAQMEEWKRLGFEDCNASASAKATADKKGTKAQGEFDLGGSSNLATVAVPVCSRAVADARMVDTKFFSEDFKSRLLRSIPDIDERCDGMLIHAENFQALNLLQERYREQVKCIYIDPPYNADATCILYKNGYRYSSWNSLILDRLYLEKRLMRSDAISCTTIDDYELYYLKLILDICFDTQNFLATVPIRNNPSGRSTVAGFAVCHEYGLYYAKDAKKSSVSRLEHSQEQKDRYDEIDEEGRAFEWENLRKSSAGSYHADRPKQYFPIYYSRVYNRIRVPDCTYNDDSESYDIHDSVIDDEIVLWPIDEKNRERVWAFGIDRVKREHDKIIAIPKNGRVELYKRKYLKEEGTLPRTWWDKAEYSARDNGSRTLANLFGSNRDFDFPKAVDAVKDTLTVMALDANGTILDYFGGSGTTAHAVIELNREDRAKGIDAKRKYILVEMGDHFDTVLKPRIEKVVYSPDWKDGKPQSTGKGISHCFKYMTLESYEDTLNNIELSDAGDSLGGMLKDEFLLKYMIDFQSRGSVINTDDFRKPFDYELKIAVDSSGASERRKVDLVETFNYLVGLKVLGMDRHIDKGYVIVEGMLPSDDKTSLVVWRDCDKIDNEALNKLLEKRSVKPGDSEFRCIFVNGDHAIPNRKLGSDENAPELKIRQIENVFLEKMFEVM